MTSFFRHRTLIAIGLTCTLVLAVALPCTLTGCKFSSTVSELVPYERATFEVDAPPVTRMAQDAKRDEEGARQSKMDNESLSEKQAAAVFDSNVKNRKYKSAEVVYDPVRATISSMPSKGGEGRAEESLDPTNAGAKDNTGVGRDGSGGDDRGNGEGKGEGSGGAEGEGVGDVDHSDEPEDDVDESDEPDTVAPESEQDEIPSGKRVAAVGEIANIVQMLTGQLRKEQLASGEADYLVGTDELFAEAVEEKGVFPCEGVGDALICWDKNDGSSGGVDVKKLKKAKVDLVLYESGTDTISSGDKKALSRAGIEAAVVSSLNQDSDIVSAVEEVAAALAKGDDANGGAILKSESSESCGWF